MSRLNKLQFLCAILFFLIGTNLCTYAYTRYATTSNVLTNARSYVDVFLKEQGFFDMSSEFTENDSAKQVSAKNLVGDILLSGGMYFWWNSALPYYGIGILLIAIGSVLPFVTGKKAMEC